ncbi:ABC transporter permease [Actinocorallia longicatena]|uniref:ABC transporter permease subunit n=1 Tax=Actinocorallia longicatena TaxID=111803 RepID=A0ABP6Q2W2_9ACTN
MNGIDGVLLVARQEFRTRLRTGRWKILLGAWFLVVGVFAVLMRLALDLTDTDDPGVPLFGTLLLFVLILTMLVAPALTAQSINGDRERGTLATLQVTRLTPWEITLGKFAAGWATGLATLLLALPFILWPIVEGAVPPLRGLVSVVVLALLIGIVCAIAQALSALVMRGITSTLLSYLAVFAAMIGTVIAFFIAQPLVATHVDRGDYIDSVDHSERVWWLLAPNPFVILADATPRLPRVQRCYDYAYPSTTDGTGTSPPVRRCHLESPDTFDPLGEIGRSVRDARLGADERDDRFAYDEEAGAPVQRSAGPVWPYGLGFGLLVAGGSLWITARRLETPARTLGKGVRIA